MKIVKKTLINIIKLYKLVISPYLGNNCRFLPTCSEYFIDSLNEHGLIKGFLMGVKRILKCHPFSRYSGYDPVPNKKQSKDITR